jgi:hypothetical protein
MVVKSDIERMQNSEAGGGMEGIEIDRYGVKSRLSVVMVRF